MEQNTSDRILACAKEIAQLHGVAGVSFRDIAARIGIKSASVHYHFATKDDLVIALVRAQRAETTAALAAIVRTGRFSDRLRDFVGLFRQHLLNGNRFCLCGMMGAEIADLPEMARQELADFFELCAHWLGAEIDAADLRLRSSSLDVARLVVASLEGAVLIARVRQDVAHFDAAIGVLLDNVLSS